MIRPVAGPGTTKEPSPCSGKERYFGQDAVASAIPAPASAPTRRAPTPPRATSTRIRRKTTSRCHRCRTRKGRRPTSSRLGTPSCPPCRSSGPLPSPPLFPRSPSAASSVACPLPPPLHPGNRGFLTFQPHPGLSERPLVLAPEAGPPLAARRCSGAVEDLGALFKAVRARLVPRKSPGKGSSFRLLPSVRTSPMGGPGITLAWIPVENSGSSATAKGSPPAEAGRVRPAAGARAGDSGPARPERSTPPPGGRAATRADRRGNAARVGFGVESGRPAGKLVVFPGFLPLPRISLTPCNRRPFPRP